MKNISLIRKKLNFKDFVKRPAKEADVSELIKEDCIIYDKTQPGKPLILYFKFNDDTSEIREACQKIPYETSKRSGGLVTTSRIFGFDPATGIRKPYCSATRLAFDNPNEHKVIVDFGARIAQIYKEYLPDVYISHEQLTIDKVRKEWQIPHTPFTSGIINKNNQLNYHFDSGNFTDVYSNMIVFKSNTAGGYLSVPEFDIGLQCADDTMVMFDGQKILHGVTPIHHYSDKAYRYSIVYYTLQQMWKCEEISDEIAKIRNRRMKQERLNAERGKQK